MEFLLISLFTSLGFNWYSTVGMCGSNSYKHQGLILVYRLLLLMKTASPQTKHHEE